MAVVVLPLAPIKSAWRNLAAGVNGDLREEIGWPELVETVAHVRDALPPGDRTHLGILTGNYGEAGAIDLYGARYGLPRAISGINSYWQRGYGDRPPETLIVLGRSHRFLTKRVRILRSGWPHVEPLRHQERGNRRSPRHLRLSPSTKTLAGDLGNAEGLRITLTCRQGVRDLRRTDLVVRRSRQRRCFRSGANTLRAAQSRFPGNPLGWLPPVVAEKWVSFR